MIEQLRFYIRHSFNDLRVNGQRTLFALLCIAAGVAAIVSLQTVGVMINDTLTGSLQETNGGDIKIESDSFSSDVSEDERDQGIDDGVLEPGAQFSPAYFGETGLAQIEAWFDENYPGSATTYQQLANPSGEFTNGFAISIPAEDVEKTFASPYIIDAQLYPLYGDRLSVDDEPLSELIQAPNDIVISENLADDKEGLGAEIGDTIRITGADTDFILRGIIPTKEEGGIEGSLFGYYYLDQSATQYFDNLTPAATTIFVRLSDPSQVEAVNAAFQRDFPYLGTTTTSDLETQNSQISEILNQLVTIMGLISLLIGGIGIVNTMLVIVSRRTTEVAVLKTIGLEPEQVTALFLVEAVIMGVLGSLLGILLGWFMAFAIQGVAEEFLSQSLTFRITAPPALTGFIVGILITTIFGFLPTLAAGQVRPALVLRPSDNVVPKAGRLLSFVALLGVLLALSIVAQGLVGQLLDFKEARYIAVAIGLVFGGLIGLTMVVGGMYAYLARENIILRVLRWGFLLGVLPIAIAIFGYFVPALVLMTAVFVIMGILYLVLWLLVWAVCGGQLIEFPFMDKLPTALRWIIPFIPPLLFLTLLIIPFRLFGLLLQGLNGVLQRFGFVDLKIAMRSMLANKGRAASALLALVVGVFTLSVITMLVDSIANQFNNLIENQIGGNVLIASTGTGTLDEIQNTLEQMKTEGSVKSYSALGSYSVALVSAEDVSTGETLTYNQLIERVKAEDSGLEGFFEFSMSGIDARELDSNLPDVSFIRGSRQLTPADAGKQVIIIEANDATVAAGLEIGDKLTFEILRDPGQPTETVTFEIVGMVDRLNGSFSIEGSPNYAPFDSFPEGVEPNQVNAIADVKEDKIKELRRSMAEIPGTFVLETRFLNDLINRLLDQFTSFPILVAGLALFTGGIVIANSVALSTMERKREIGIMKAVGVQRERVLGMLLLENALMGFIGGIIGVGISFVQLVLLLKFVFDSNLGEAVPYETAFTLMGVCILISLLAALLTIWGASGEKPLNVLRYE